MLSVMQKNTTKGDTDWATSYKMGMLLRKFKIKMAHILAINSSHMLRPGKDDLGVKISEIYNIPCECGKGYTRQTSQSTETSCKEHDQHL
jgi:hypothetical protein